MLSKNAFGNMKNRYVSVLKKCRLLNAFGTLALVGMLGLATCGGMVADAWAGDLDAYTDSSGNVAIVSATFTVTGNEDVTGTTMIAGSGTLNINSGAIYNATGKTMVNATLNIDKGGIYNAIDETEVGGGNAQLNVSGTYNAMSATTVSNGSLTVISGGIYNAMGTTEVGNGNALNVNGIYNAKDTTTIKGTLNVNSGGIYNATGATTITDWGSINVDTGGIYNAGSSDVSWVTTAMGATGLDADNLAILAIYQANMLNVTYPAKVCVGTTSSTDNINFDENSLLVVNSSQFIGSDYAVTAATINTDAKASLLLTSSGLFDSADTATVNIAQATTSLGLVEGAWGYSSTEAYDADSLYLDTSFIQVDAVTYDANSNTYSITVSVLSVTDVLGDTVNPNLATLIPQVAFHGTSASKAFVDELVKSTAEEAEGAHKLSTGAAVSQSMDAANKAFTGTINQRTAIGATNTEGTGFDGANTSTYLAMNGDALIVPLADGGHMAQGFALWAMPMFNYTSADGFSSGNFSYGFDSVLYGLSMGGDYTFAHDFRLGMAFSAGRGSSESTGDFAETENDFDFYGLSLYGLKRFGNLGLSFDLGYMKSENEVVQDASFGYVYADMDAELVTAALKAEYLMRHDGLNLTPYAGVRVNYYAVDSYDGYWSGAARYHNASENHTIVEFPLGLTVDTTYQAGDWTLTPRASLGVKYAAGDLDAEQKVSYEGVAGSAVLSSEVADAVTFQGALGLGMKMDAYSIDFGYSLDLSENVQSHGVNLNLRYEF